MDFLIPTYLNGVSTYKSTQQDTSASLAAALSRHITCTYDLRTFVSVCVCVCGGGGGATLNTASGHIH